MEDMEEEVVKVRGGGEEGEKRVGSGLARPPKCRSLPLTFLLASSNPPPHNGWPC